MSTLHSGKENCVKHSSYANDTNYTKQNIRNPGRKGNA